MKDRKILFFDIDETLLSHRTLGVPESAKRAIKKAKENGHLLFINTGRTISVVNREIKYSYFLHTIKWFNLYGCKVTASEGFMKYPQIMKCFFVANHL